MSLSIRSQSQVIAKPEVTPFNRQEAQASPVKKQAAVQGDRYESSFGDVKGKSGAVEGLIAFGGAGLGASSVAGFVFNSKNAYLVGMAFTGVIAGAIASNSSDNIYDAQSKGILFGAAAGAAYGAVTMGKIGAMVGGVTGLVTGALGATWAEHSAKSGNLYIDRK